MAIDLGCGEGTDALELLARGWSVMAVDAEPAGLALLRARIPPSAAGRVRVLCASFAEADLPCAHLLHAGFSLPFCPPRKFPAMWARIGQALAPGGVFAGQLFGIRDSWADDPDMTFHTRRQVEVLLDGLDILRLTRPKGTGTPSAAPSTGTPSTSSPASQSASTRRRRRPASQPHFTDAWTFCTRQERTFCELL
jgi:SAM-dependent methyltransferase